jgi:hypothetical protein
VGLGVVVGIGVSVEIGEGVGSGVSVIVGDGRRISNVFISLPPSILMVLLKITYPLCSTLIVLIPVGTSLITYLPSLPVILLWPSILTFTSATTLLFSSVTMP